MLQSQTHPVSCGPSPSCPSFISSGAFGGAGIPQISLFWLQSPLTCSALCGIVILVKCAVILQLPAVSYHLYVGG